MTATIKHHDSPHDWCHLCGERSDANAGVWWASNAEHDRGPVYRGESVAAGRYVRICYQCSERIGREADPTRPLRDCGIHPDAAERLPCWSIESGRPLCDLCAARAAVAMAREPVDDALRERDDARDERDHSVDMVKRADALVMRLANALDEVHADHVEGFPDCEACAAIAVAREWAR